MRANMAKLLKEKISSTQSKIVVILSMVVLLIVYVIGARQFTPYSYVGQVENNHLIIAPEVAGKIDRVFVKDGEKVSAGTPLLRIEPKPYLLKKQHMQAALFIAQDKVKALKAAIHAADHQIQAQEAMLVNARQRFAEIQKLELKDYASLRNLQAAQASLSESEANLAKFKMQKVRLEKDLGSSIHGENVHILQAKARYGLSQYYHGKTTILAPVSGTVDNLNIIAGNYAKPGTTLLTMIPKGDWWLQAYFVENSVRHISVGHKAWVSLDMYPGQVFTAKVISVGKGIRIDQEPKPALLPFMKSNRHWIKLPYLFPVRFQFVDLPPEIALRKGAQFTIIVKNEHGFFWNSLGWVWVHIRAWLHYIL